MSTVNIIMSTYNGAKYIASQIDSILGSNYTDWNLYISDDASQDDTTTIVEQYVNQYPERIFLHKNSFNKGAAQNFLEALYTFTHIESASVDFPKSSNMSQYFMFCDQDDIWDKNKIEDTLRRMKLVEKKYGKEKPALVFSDARLVDEKLKIISPSFYRTTHLDIKNLGFAGLLMENKCIGCTMMINRSLLNMVYSIPVHARMHDVWIALIASAFGHINFLPEITTDYRQHDKNVIGGEQFCGYIRKRLLSLADQKESLEKNWLQAKEFYELYADKLDNEKKHILEKFIDLPNRSWCIRRIRSVKYRFKKSGFARNVGLFFVL